MATKRAHIVIPSALIAEIDLLVGKRKRSKFLAAAALRELKRLRMLKALEGVSGAWKDQDHPELRRGAGRWVDKVRREDAKRFPRATR